MLNYYIFCDLWTFSSTQVLCNVICFPSHLEHCTTYRFSFNLVSMSFIPRIFLFFLSFVFKFGEKVMVYLDCTINPIYLDCYVCSFIEFKFLFKCDNVEITNLPFLTTCRINIEILHPQYYISYFLFLCQSVYSAFLHYDVLSNSYISALSEDEKQPNLQTAILSGWPASLHLIGKVVFY